MTNVDKMRIIWRKQLDFVNSIIEDIIANNASKEVLEHVAGYAHIEAPIPFEGWSESSSIRVNFGEAYAYIEHNNGELTGNISWNNDEMGISNPACTAYESSIDYLEHMTEIPTLDDVYDDIDANDYAPAYKKFA